MDGTSRGGTAWGGAGAAARLRGEHRIVVIGAANIDIQGTSARTFLAGDSNPGRIVRAPGGVGRNIAENLARLGNRVEFIAALGTDADSDLLSASCASLGIGTDGILRTDAPCPTYLCLSDPDGRLVGAVADMAAAAALGPDVLESRTGILDSADAIIVDANIPGDSIAWIAARYGRHSSRSLRRPLLAFDPVSVAKSVRARDCLGEFDLAKPNLSELAALAGGEAVPGVHATPGAEDLESLAASLRARGRMPGSLFVSLGESGMAYLEPGRESGEPARFVALPLPPRESRPPTLNRSGAGDAACAALVAAALSGLTPRACAACAIAAALLAAASDSPVHSGVSARAVSTLAGIALRE